MEARVTKAELRDWKSSLVTEEFYRVVAERIREAEAILGKTAGLDSNKDRFLVGMIHALNEVLEFDVETKDDEQTEL